MINRGLIENLKIVSGLNATAIASDTTTNGISVDMSGTIDADVENIGIILKVDGRVAGEVKVKEIQMSSVADFTSDVSTYDVSNAEIHFIKSDSNSDVDALTQTIIATANTVKKLGFHCPSFKQYLRVNVISSGGANLTVSIVLIIKQNNTPVNQ